MLKLMKDRKDCGIGQAGSGILFPVVFLLGFILIIGFQLTGCMSRTVSGERFRDSRLLSLPPLEVTLADPERFSFAIVGDIHSSTARLDTIVAQAASEGDAFLMLLGDIVDQGEAEEFARVKDILSARGWSRKVLPVIGNHDVFRAGWEHYRDTFGPSHYATEIGTTRFIAVDTADGTIDETQSDWLASELALSRGKRTFLMSHYLPTVPGVRTYLRLANEEDAARWMKLAMVNGVTAWLGAHYHSYVSAAVEGVQYVVAGGGGGRRMPPIEAYFYVRVVVDNQAVSYEIRPVD